MATTYDYSKDPVQPARLEREIEEASLPTPTSIVHNDNETPYDLHITFASALTGPQETTLGTVVTNHDGSSGTAFPSPRSGIQGARASWTSVSQVTIGESGVVSVVDADDGSESFGWTGAITGDITSSGAGGLDTGSEAADTWYAVWVIADSTNLNAVKVLLSASFTAPTMPDGYDLKRLVWAVRNNASSDFFNFIQTGTGTTRACWWNENSANVRPLVNGNATTWTDVDCSSYMPTFSDVGIFQVNFETGTAGATNDEVEIRPDGITSSTISVHPGFKSSVKAFYQVLCPVSSAQKIEYKCDDTANEATIVVVGWYMDV
jgi:hypothetical protein